MTDRMSTSEPGANANPDAHLEEIDNNQSNTSGTTTDSHSAQFGLTPQSKPSQTAGSGPGSGVGSGSGVQTSATKAETTAGIQESTGTNAAAGAGSSTMTPSQGSGKV